MSIKDKEGTELVPGDYIESLFVNNSLIRRGIQNYNFKRVKKYGIVLKVCPKTVKVQHYHTKKKSYLYSDEVRKMTGSEAMFHKLRTAEKI